MELQDAVIRAFGCERLNKGEIEVTVRQASPARSTMLGLRAVASKAEQQGSGMQRLPSILTLTRHASCPVISGLRMAVVWVECRRPVDCGLALGCIKMASTRLQPKLIRRYALHLTEQKLGFHMHHRSINHRPGSKPPPPKLYMQHPSLRTPYEATLQAFSHALMQAL